MAKIPPPPNIAASDPLLNRWLLELTATLNGQGDIDPGSIAGFEALQNDVEANTAGVATNTAAITVLGNQIAGVNLALSVRSAVLNGAGAPAGALGNNGDWYADTTNLHIYVKVAGAWLLIV